MGIDATRKSRHDPADFERAWPINWGKVRLEDYLVHEPIRANEQEDKP